MVVLFLESTSTDFVTHLENPIRDPKWVLLHSAKYPLSRVLEEEGTIRSEGKTLLSIPVGEYMVASVKKALAGALSLGSRPAWIVSSGGSHKLHLQAKAHPNKALRRLLGISKKVGGKQILERSSVPTSLPIDWPIPDTIWVHCDLVDTDRVGRARKTVSIARRADILGGICSAVGNSLQYSNVYPMRIRARPVEWVSSLRLRFLDGEGVATPLQGTSLSIILEME